MRLAFIIGIVILLLLSVPGVLAFGADVLGYGVELNTWAENKLGVSHRLALAIPPAIMMFCVPILITLLYFLRLKRKPMAVASTYLWKKSVEDLHVNRLMQWMRRNILLLLQLLAILLLFYAILGPRTMGALSAGKPYILMIDNSISMSATDVSPTRLDWAKDEAIKIIDSANESDPGLLIVFNSTAEIRQSFTFNKEELKAAVRAVEPTQHTTRLDEALALAASRANPTKSTENAAVAPANPEPGKERTYFSPDGFESDVYLLSDGRFPAVNDFALQNLNIKFPEMPVDGNGGFSNNVAIVGFDAQRDPDQPGRVYSSVLVANYRAEAKDLVVNLSLMTGDGKLQKAYTSGVISIPGKPADLPPEDKPKPIKPGLEARPANIVRVPFVVTEVTPNTDLKLEAKLDHGSDALPADDTASIVFGVARKAKVLVVTPGNKWLRNYFDLPSTKAIADFTYLMPTELADAKAYLGPAREGEYDLVVFDRCGPPDADTMPMSNTLFVGHAPPPYTMTGTGDNAVTAVKNPSVRAPDSRHPLMKDIRSLEELRLEEAFRLPTLPPRTPRLIEADNDLSLMVAISRQTYTDVVMAFPIATVNIEGPDELLNTTWPLQPSFVVFLRQVLYRLGDVRDTGADDPLKPGQIVPLRPAAEKEIRLTMPGASVPTILQRGKRPDIIFSGTDKLGVYTAEWGTGKTTQTRRFAVNLLDAEESNLAPVNQFKIGAIEVTSGEARRVPLELWKLAIVLGLIVAMIEWWIYNRRVQI
jgi:von Willebrand factor type A domain/Aerotolerance regulator N-terminal